MIRQLLLLTICFIALMGCEEETYYPPGLYGHQVERLISGGEEKVWALTGLEVDGQNQNIEGCANAVELHVYEGLTAINVYQVTTCEVPDTLYYGEMTASEAGSSASNEHVFTDSLLFENGAVSYVIVKEVTSLRLKFDRYIGGKKSTYQWVAR
ncbi:MAG: hypothetical protein RIC30_05180 [Marinoscillum sp.]|uniref:hypothetical protein n=1 Tax=Marinoscillum sp. TaxID=2024838 RepID=UPI0032F17BF8